MKSISSDWRILAAIGAGVALAIGVGASQWLRRPEDPDETERRRRSHINKVGRIVEGHIVEYAEVAPSNDDKTKARLKQVSSDGDGLINRKVVCYSYSISGVSYETAQDVTGLEGRTKVHQLVAGQPASVKYDPSNPSDSILIAEEWSGVS